MKYEIRNRFTGSVQVIAEIDCSTEDSTGKKVGLAVKHAILGGANLRWANLSRADLSGADLSGADLRWADLSGADLSGADLRWADLRWADLRWADLREVDLSRANLREVDLITYKSDLFRILSQSRAEVVTLMRALLDGRIDGSTYAGDCACLIGTIANARGVSVGSLECDSSRPAEKWFSMIRPDNKPSDQTGGGYASRMALEWCREWCALNNVDVPPELAANATSFGKCVSDPDERTHLAVECGND